MEGRRPIKERNIEQATAPRTQSRISELERLARCASEQHVKISGRSSPRCSDSMSPSTCCGTATTP